MPARARCCAPWLTAMRRSRRTRTGCRWKTSNPCAPASCGISTSFIGAACTIGSWRPARVTSRRCRAALPTATIRRRSPIAWRISGPCCAIWKRRTSFRRKSICSKSAWAPACAAGCGSPNFARWIRSAAPTIIRSCGSCWGIIRSPRWICRSPPWRITPICAASWCWTR